MSERNSIYHLLGLAGLGVASATFGINFIPAGLEQTSKAEALAPTRPLRTAKPVPPPASKPLDRKREVGEEGPAASLDEVPTVVPEGIARNEALEQGADAATDLGGLKPRPAKPGLQGSASGRVSDEGADDPGMAPRTLTGKRTPSPLAKPPLAGNAPLQSVGPDNPSPASAGTEAKVAADTPQASELLLQPTVADLLQVGSYRTRRAAERARKSLLSDTGIWADVVQSGRRHTLLIASGAGPVATKKLEQRIRAAKFTVRPASPPVRPKPKELDEPTNGEKSDLP